MVLIAEMRSTIGGEEHAAPTIEPMALPLEVVMYDFSGEVSINRTLTEMVSKISTKGCSEKDPTEIV